MRLKKLILNGFKSFADKVEIPFEDGITGVVGPNGCGKSNIADAVRWVLGEQSAKSLRGVKMEDVIFNGTEARRRLAYCEVTLIFDNTDHELPIDFAEVSVLRRVFRNGDGEYRLNGTLCRLKDIIDLFRDTGIGKDGYSMIGQGRIDEILSVRSEDRRQVFEEAAGIVKYKSRKTEAEKRIEHTLENLSRVEDILEELEKRVEPLRRQSETARRYLTLREELKGLELNAFLLKTDRYEARLAELQAQLDAMTEAVGRNNELLDSLNRESAEAAAALEKLEAASAGERETVQTLIQLVEEAEGENNILKERIASETRERDRVSAQREAALEGREGVDRRITEMTQAIQAETESLQTDEAEQAETEKQLSALESELASRETTLEENKARIIRAMNRLSDVRSQKARLSAMQTALTQQLERMSQDQSREANRSEALAAHVGEARENVRRESDLKNTLNAMTAKLQAEVSGLGESAAALTEKINALQAERQTKAARLNMLREMQRDYEGYNNSVKQVLLQAKRTGGAGVHGVVADLIRVPERLERAVDMVLGASLQNIVTDRDEDAKRMIEYLRVNRFGRATFLPISAMRGRTLTPQERKLLTMPGCIGVASELITFEPKYQGIVDSLLGRTVIAEDMNAGIAIQRAGHYQFRLVTLEGDVMNPGGSMTGGSVQSRMTSLLSRSREIEETEKTLRALDAQLSEKRAAYQKQDEKRAQLKRERAEAFDQAHQQEIALARAETQLKAAVEEERKLREQSERNASERERLEAQLADVRTSLAGLNDAQQSEEGDTDALQAQVSAEQEALYALRTRIEAIRKSAGDRRVSLATRRRGLQADTDTCRRLSEQANNTEKLLRNSEEALKLSAERLCQMNCALEKGTADLKSRRETLETARARFDETEKRRTGAQKRTQSIASQVSQVRDDLELQSDKYHKSEVQKTRIEGEFKQMRDHIWEDYELTYANAEPFRDPNFKITEAEKRTGEIRREIRSMGSVNVSAVDDYRQTTERVTELRNQRDDLLKAQSDLEGIISDLEVQMEKQFRRQFALIADNFSKTFVRLFGGGSAQLQLMDDKDVLNCGIEIVAQPPGKKLQTLTLLSGGERALTAIAILFAILDLKPSPFCILDEIEAALDDANIDTYADYLKGYSANTQFIVITHRKGTMARCNALFGVVMEEKGISKTVSVRLNE